jgi:energy-coupling factor transport system ATP-binding protein
MVLSLRAVSASYPIDQKRMVVHEVTLDVHDSGCLALVGPSGSGKSTIGRLMNGLHKPAAGTVELDGKNLQELDSIAEARRRVGLLMQQPDNQLFGMTVGEDIRFGPELAGIDLETSQRRLESAMELVGLDKERFVSRSPFSLSGGERRRVALAGLLAMQPRHLVLDEPAAGLDPAGRESIEQVISDTGTRIGVVLLTADLPLALRLADRVVLLDAGRIVYDGAPSGAVADRDLLQRLRLLAPVEADVLEALKGRGAPVGPLVDMRPASVFAAISDAMRQAPRVPESARGQDTPC